LEARLDGLQEFYNLVTLFTSTINSFFTGKTISYSIREGIVFKTKGGELLQPHLLSSGEQHLLLLLCNVLVAKQHPSIFFIDEPELSLNIKWQRNFIDSLLALSDGTAGQFILASHSIELISQHKSKVVKLNQP